MGSGGLRGLQIPVAAYYDTTFRKVVKSYFRPFSDFLERNLDALAEASPAFLARAFRSAFVMLFVAASVAISILRLDESFLLRSAVRA
jgi:hypothetical protein